MDSIERLLEKNLDQFAAAMLLEDWAAEGPLFDRGEQLYNLLCCAREDYENRKEMTMESEMLSNLEREQNRLLTARDALKNRSDNNLTRLLELGKSLPTLMVAVALGEEPAEKLDALNAEVARLHLVNMEPLNDALALLDIQLSGVQVSMSNERARLIAVENQKRFHGARDEIAAKGGYSVLEIDHLEHLATVAGAGNEFRRFKAALDNYTLRRETSQNRADFPPFVFDE